ncbi:MAG: ParA family protein [Anaerolineales bacterium]|nr:ParA family protein [Anaerolineales bacterium]
MTYYIAVANQKGGVAKTTTVLSLGGALVQKNKEVLVVDLDAQADLTLALGVNPSKVRHSIADVLFNWANVISVSRETSIPGLDVVPSNNEMELAERFLPIRKNYETILKNGFKSPLPYDFVLMDCPPSLGAVTINALNLASLLLIPTVPEYFSVHALRNMLVQTRRLRNQSNYDLIYRILITMQDLRNRIHRNMSEQLNKNLGDRVLKNVINIDTKLRESSVAGVPISYYAPKSRSAAQYEALADEIIEYSLNKYEEFEQAI